MRVSTDRVIIVHLRDLRVLHVCATILVLLMRAEICRAGTQDTVVNPGDIYDDFHYPEEELKFEKSELEASLPTVVAFYAGGIATLRDKKDASRLHPIAIRLIIRYCPG